jgi:PhnB protein
MPVTPYLSFEGRCEEALEFYKKAVGAEVRAVMRFADSPEGMPAGMAPEAAQKVMHSEFVVAGSTLMGSDGHCTGKTQSGGISLALTEKTPADAERVFAALSDGGQVHQPLIETFFSPKFGVVVDKFDVSWMVLCESPDHGS